MKISIVILIIGLLSGLAYYYTQDNNSSKAATNYYSKVKNKGMN